MKDWSPEDESDPESIQREMIDLAKESLKHLKENRMHPPIGPFGVVRSVAVVIRKIGNGFLMTFPSNRPHDAGDRELFVADADQAAKILPDAMRALDGSLHVIPFGGGPPAAGMGE